MKKNALIILAALLFCTACQSNPAGSASDNSEPTSSTAPVNSGSSEPDKPAQTSENANAEEGNPTEITEQSSTAETSGTAESTGDAFFKPGIWQCSEYYFYEFYADGTGGIVMDFDCYMGQPFRYEVTDSDSGALMFHIFSADDQSPAAAKIISDTEIELTWDFGRTDTLGGHSFLNNKNALRCRQAPTTQGINLFSNGGISVSVKFLVEKALKFLGGKVLGGIRQADYI